MCPKKTFFSMITLNVRINEIAIAGIDGDTCAWQTITAALKARTSVLRRGTDSKEYI